MREAAKVGSLVDALLNPGRREAVLQDAVRMVDEEVGSKSGITGLAIKGAYKMVRTLRADFVPAAMELLLPDFASRLDPLYAERQLRSPSTSMEDYLRGRAEEVATALLSITDERVNGAAAGVRSAYLKLRPMAERHVADAAPGIGRLLDRHLPRG